jgi:hypothetical protein
MGYPRNMTLMIKGPDRLGPSYDRTRLERIEYIRFATILGRAVSYVNSYSAKQVSCQQARGAPDSPTSPMALERQAWLRQGGVMMDMLAQVPLEPRRKSGV